MSLKACLSPFLVIPSPMMTQESLIVRARVRTLKSLCPRSQSVFRSYILSRTYRNACSELSLVVDEPTIIPAAFWPWPETLLAVVVLPPSVPRSVTVKVSSARACANPMRKTQTAAKLILFRVFIGGGVHKTIRIKGLQRSNRFSKNKIRISE